MPCLIVRHSELGSLCGYVAVPPGHPLHGVDYESAGLHAHREVNYASPCFRDICHVPAPGEPDNVWWFGFECGGLHDFQPGLSARSQRIHTLLGYEDCQYRDINYVKEQCRELARQLRERG